MAKESVIVSPYYRLIKAKKALFLSLNLLSLFVCPLIAQPAFVDVLSEQPQSDDNKVYYFFAFHCHACQKWSAVFEPMLEQLQEKKVQVYASPLAMDKGQYMLAKAYHIAKQSGLSFKTQQFFDFYQNSYFLSEKKIKSFLSTLSTTGQDYWVAQSSLLAESKIKKSGLLAQKYGVNATPYFLVLNNKGAFGVYPSENLHPQKIPTVLNELLFEQAH